MSYILHSFDRIMGFGHPGRALLARIGQFLLLAQVLLTVQAHPFHNHSIAYTGEDNHLNTFVERASASEFTALSRNTKMLVHNSCTSKMNLQAWQTVLDALTVVVSYPAPILYGYEHICKLRGGIASLLTPMMRLGPTRAADRISYLPNYRLLHLD